MPTATDPVHFLLVDDLEENLLALEAVLRREGAILHKARSGSEALELLLRHEVALALIDVQMPEMDGFELAELMRGTERTRRVPIIFLTAANADQQRRFRGYEAGAVDFLHKPLETDVIRSKADVFFELDRQRREVARQRDELKAATEVNARLLRESQQYAEALKETDRRKDEFLAMLAHELRNPLSAISAAAQLSLMLDQEGALADNNRAILRQATHLSRLIDDLLEASRVGQGKIRLQKETVELRALVDRAVELGRASVEKKKHELRVIRPDVPTPFEADPVRIEQILGNLLTNAAKYTDPGGLITLQAAQEGDEIVLRVKDTGVGITRELQSHIFDLFVQVDSSIDRSQGGLGIGLTLVKNLVDLHGGTVSVASNGPGTGSEFTVRLPVGRPCAKSDRVETKPGPPATKSRVLVVDDNADTATLSSRYLSMAGFEVRTAHDGHEAVTAAREFHPEVILLDIGLPGQDGYEVARILRADGRFDDTLMVAVSGYGDEQAFARSREAGFDHHLTKPIQFNALFKLIGDRAAPRPG